ncbi:Hypothetical predicted protein, partial [Paramuricea clavata]
MAMEQQENADPNIAENSRLYRNTHQPQSQEIRRHFKCSKRRSYSDPMNKTMAKRRRDTVQATNLKPKDWNRRSVKHRQKFEQLLKLWESEPQFITMINDNGICFKEEFAIGRGSDGTE